MAFTGMVFGSGCLLETVVVDRIDSVTSKGTPIYYVMFGSWSLWPCRGVVDIEVKVKRESQFARLVWRRIQYLPIVSRTFYSSSQDLPGSYGIAVAMESSLMSLPDIANMTDAPLDHSHDVGVVHCTVSKKFWESLP